MSDGNGNGSANGNGSRHDSKAEALANVARRIEEQGVLLYDGLQGFERDAADTLIASRAVETYETEEGFLFLRPLGFSILNVLRGQLGTSNLLHRLASGRVSRGP